MDPTTTWKEMNAALREADWATVIYHAESLLRWLNQGGFPPANVRVAYAIRTCRDLLRFARAKEQRA